LCSFGKCRRPHNRLGFAYQVAFVRLFDRFPQQQPFELLEELVCFSAAQVGLDAGLIELYRKRQPTISEHQQTIADYLRLRPFDDAVVRQLEQFIFEEDCRLEQAVAASVPNGLAGMLEDCWWPSRTKTSPACRRSKPIPAIHPWMRCSLCSTN
jgi:hypothetical protein